MSKERSPYFNYLLKAFSNGNKAIERSFGQHIHWGYWERNDSASNGDKDYQRAAFQMSIELCKKAGIQHEQKVLDVGCGFGGTLSLINVNFQHMELVGLDIDPLFLDRARHNVQLRDTNHVSFINGNASSLPFPDNSFDRIISVQSIFQFPDRTQFLQEARRTLKPGGILSITDFLPSPLIFMHAKAMSYPIFKRWLIFGNAQLIGLNRYRSLARTLDLNFHAYDITSHTLPTYPYLTSMYKRFPAPFFQQWLSLITILHLEWASKLHLLNYYILRFEKPMGEA